MRSLLRVLKYALASVAALGLAGVVTAAVGYYLLAPDLPPVERLREVEFQQPLRVYTRDGALIGEFGSQRRIPLRYGEFPPKLINAFIAAEDQRFFEHPGVDYQGIMRAVWHLVRTGEKGPGGSTITMQVARNFFLSPEQTYIRKAREILLALEIDRLLPKEEIMALYLNKIYLGEGAYGAAAAAQIYYGRKPSGLTLAETAMIAGLPKAPSAWNPVANPDRAVERRNYVLRRMHEQGMIDDSAYREARQAPVTAEVHRVRPEVSAPYVAEAVRRRLVQRFGEEAAYTRGYRVYTTISADRQRAAQSALRKALHGYDERHGWRGPAGHWELGESPDAEALRERLDDDYPGVASLTNAVVTGIGEDAVTVVSADRGEAWQLPFDAMAWARPFVNRQVVGKKPGGPGDVLERGDVIRVRDTDEGPRLAQVPEAQGALVSLRPEDGAVEALVGGYDFGLSKFNRVLQARRQPGSAFKPLIYSAALANGFTPATLVNDAPVVFHDPSLESTWRPENYSQKFYGPTRLRQALIHSRNLVSIRVLRRVGIGPALAHLARFGLDPEALPHNLSLALGTASLTPMQLARAYTVFSNGGYLVDPYLIDRVENDVGEVVYEPVRLRVCDDGCPSGHAVTAEGAARSAADQGMMQTALADVMPLPERTQSILPAPRVLPADNAWLITSMMQDVIRQGTGRGALVLDRDDLSGKTGTTNDQVDAWFSGFNHSLVTTSWVGFDESRPLGRAETGARAALPMWIDYMGAALEGEPSSTLSQPPGIVSVGINPESGLVAREGSESMTEYFREGNVPDREPPNAGGGYGSTADGSSSGSGGGKTLF
ncbi:penicillin-binding protein 1A [Arhodomonas aquaeolei]|uniref:penicillin-binding protein 1A n=1 Tax=Arhodomonas aquaeolei TaxID=2369 RepID=UPI002167B47E|nr:penicillin-binding protein 1A [Arhodomonas aquaeolei]MCS4505291.1 penicillin-binding protein 1A [Arhodomonas aquaeolei]